MLDHILDKNPKIQIRSAGEPIQDGVTILHPDESYRTWLYIQQSEEGRKSRLIIKLPFLLKPELLYLITMHTVLEIETND